MRFEWDENKNRTNFRKHGIWFEEAQTIWTDVASREFFDPDSSDFEDRYIRIGHSLTPKLLLVVFCERAEGEMIRIISARKATKKEANTYHEKRVQLKKT
jgi:hypothetical protein